MSNILRTRTPCYSLHLYVLSNGAKKWPKIATAAHLSSDNSKKKTASRFCQAYSSGGVSALDVENEVGVLEPLRLSLESHKVEEVKMADFG